MATPSPEAIKVWLTQHPGTTAAQAMAALSGTPTVNPEVTIPFAVIKNAQSGGPFPPLTQQQLPPLTQQQIIAALKIVNPDDATSVLDQIKALAPTSDPTAVKTTGAGAGTGPTPIGADMNSGSSYTNNYAADFTGGVAGATPLQITQTTSGKFVITRSDAAGALHQVVIIPNPTDPTRYMVSDVSNIPSLANQYVAANGGLAAVKQQLDNGKWFANPRAAQTSMTNPTTMDDAFYAAFSRMLLANTNTNYNLGKIGYQSLIPISQTLTGQAAGGLAGTRNSTNYTITPAITAEKDLNGFIQQNLGRQATSKEQADYLKSLNAYEKAHPDRKTATTDQAGYEKTAYNYLGATQADKDALKVGLLHDELTAKGINPDAISASGGVIAQGMQNIQDMAAKYGLGHMNNVNALGAIIDNSQITASKMTNADTLALMTETLKPGGDVNQIYTKLKEQAKLTYKPLSNYIDAGGTIKDIADQYHQLNQKYLETVAPADVFNPDIQKALQGDGKGNLMSLNDYTIMLKNKPEWMMTSNARDEASNYANTILKSFGLVS
jgi:hypothetical protein